MQSIKLLSKSKVLVIRQPKLGSDKGEQIINCCDIVPGDVVVIRSGQKIPADLIVITANNFKIDNSSLTVFNYI